MTTSTRIPSGYRPGDYCPGSGHRETLSPDESRQARCRSCGREVGVRRNIYGTVLGIARHKIVVSGS